MPTLTVNTILLRDRQVLLTKREDFEVWCLPGGHVDPGESVRDAAVREAKEETGFDVRLDRLVGVYSAVGDWPDMHACSFAATIDGERGALGTPEEVLDVRWFPVNALPTDIIWWHLQRIDDAINGREGVVVSQPVTSRIGKVDRVSLYAARDASGLARSEFFTTTFPRPG